MIDDIFLRWFVTGLFGLAIVECAYSLVGHRMRWPGVIGHLLHIAMSVAMLVMAWPFSSGWPTVGPMVFFIVAAVWFAGAGLALASSGDERMADGYHTVMMAAMAWMYAVMNGNILPGTGSDAPMAMGMPGMTTMSVAHSHGGTDMQVDVSQPGYVTVVDWVLGIGFLVAAVVWLYVYFGRRRGSDRPAGLLTHAGELCQVFMAAGMGIMFLQMV
ncbi:DUF5134 domain-containing protein [Gordonia sp. NPDC003424]